MRPERRQRWLRSVLLVLTVVGVGAFGAGWAFIRRPLPPSLCSYRGVASLRVLDRDGGLLRDVPGANGVRMVPVPLASLPPYVAQAFLAAEDHRFREHAGVSASAVARALWTNVRHGAAREGGSTLTQQLARLLVPRRRTMLGKVQEALWAWRLEAHLSKDELLAQYLNRVPLGDSTAGVEAASQRYFGKSASALSLGQAAALAALPKAPARLAPSRAPAKLVARREWVLARMAALHMVPPQEAAWARAEPLDLRTAPPPFRAPHFVSYVLAHLNAWGMGEATVVQTSLDASLQAEAERSVTEELATLSSRHVTQAAVLAVDNTSDEVLAYVGSASFSDDDALGKNDGVQSLRPPGSSLKPFLYALAFSRGTSPQTLLEDAPRRFAAGAEGAVYIPRNYVGTYHGKEPARLALANSYNVPAVALAEQVGVSALLETLRGAGYSSFQNNAEYYGLGLALGDAEASLWMGTRAYEGLALGGMRHALRVIRNAWRADGTELPLPSAERPQRFVEPEAAAQVTDVLADNAARAPAFGIENALRFDFPVAAKTGTSKGYSDNWTFGFTPERTVGVWAGNFDASPMTHVSGITGAGPIFHRVMLAAQARR